MNKLAEKAKIEQLREEILEMLKTQNFISKIRQGGEVPPDCLTLF